MQRDFYGLIVVKIEKSPVINYRLYNLPAMAGQYFFLICCPVVHAASFAIPVLFASGTLSGLRPFPVAVNLEAVVPYINEIVLVDVALNKASVNVWTCPNAAVNQDGTDVNACPAEESVVPDLLFIPSYVAFTAEFYFDPVFRSFGFDKLH